ncbi:MAG: DUF1365 domain-containing protein [Pirellulaceae bacterium]
MHSCIYEGRVTHCRYSPVIHKFDYRLYMVYLDLDEWRESPALRARISANKFSWGSFLRTDHLATWTGPLDDAVRDLVAAKTGHRPRGPIRVLTQLRYLGYYFSPINLFYCYDADERRVEAIVAEVTNTPWREQHHYVLWDGNCTDRDSPMKYSHPKGFHVSPFMDMNMDYHWTLAVPSDKLRVHLENHVDHDRLFDATLVLERVPLTRRHLRRMFFRHPWMTASIMGAIHWQAMRLWWKKCPFYSHPKKRDTLTPAAD